MLRRMHEQLVEAEVRLVEANSELESLQVENAEINQGVEELRNTIAQLEQQKRNLRNEWNRIRDAVQADIQNMSVEERTIMQEYSQLPSIEDLNNEIEAVNTRLELMAEGNPQAVQAYETRERDIANREAALAVIAENLETTREQITAIREQWEPELDTLIATISDSFSHNFAQIGCAGQVGVHKDEDFEKWSIQIQVRFR